MRHVTLTCVNHPQLRWTCKSIAWTPTMGYNGQRNIFFQGLQDGSYVPECTCSAELLKLAPEDRWYGLSADDLAKARAEDIG